MFKKNVVASLIIAKKQVDGNLYILVNGKAIVICQIKVCNKYNVYTYILLLMQINYVNIYISEWKFV